jgi:hypothetical protein
MVAAFGNLQVGVMARRKAHALRRHQIEERIVGARHGLMHRRHHSFVLLRTGYGQNVRVLIANAVALHTQTPGDDHATVLSKRFADGFQRFRYGAVEKDGLLRKTQVLITTASAPSKAGDST